MRQITREQRETLDALTRALALGQHAPERQWCYRAFCRDAMELGVIEELRSATNGGYGAGNASFKQEIAERLKRRVEPGQPGRPQTRITDSAQPG